MRHAGLILCALAFAAAGVWRAVTLYRRAKLISALSLLAAYIREQVVRYAKEQKEICQCFQNERLEKAGFLPLLRAESEKRPWGALDRSFTRFFETTDPGKEVKEACLAFAASFGMTGMAEQAASCETFDRCMREIARREEKEIWNRIRLSVGTGFAAGCGFMILFW